MSAQLTWTLLVCFTTASVYSRGSVQRIPVHQVNLTALEGGTILLPCTVSNHTGVVTWLRPNEHTLVSQDYDVLDQIDSSNIEVVGESTRGQYGLLLKYVTYPRDHGQWICGNAASGQLVVSLTVLVPPAEFLPVVTPVDVSQVDLTSEAWTFTCSAHFAYPPVDLVWVKVIGHDFPFDVTPPTMVMSPMKTIASSVKLVLSVVHAGSVFACHARHPAYEGQVFSSNIHYALPPELQVRAMAQRDGGSGTSDGPRSVKRPAAGVSSSTLFGVDHVILIVLCLLGAAAFLVVVILVMTRKCWELDVKYHRHYVQHASRDLAVGKPFLSEESLEKLELQRFGYNMYARRERRACRCRVTLATSIAVVLVLCLTLAIPTYLKGITIPPLGTDATTSVLAGSPLWLDCSPLASPLTSLIQVNWRKNSQLFYRQYLVNGENVGFQHNSSLGYSLGGRVTSQRPGQINVWPMLPDETDAYTCEVALMEDNGGRTVVRRFTTAVFVTMGPIQNWVLLLLLAIALVALVPALVLTFTHSIRCLRNRDK